MRKDLIIVAFISVVVTTTVLQVFFITACPELEHHVPPVKIHNNPKVYQVKYDDNNLYYNDDNYYNHDPDFKEDFYDIPVHPLHIVEDDDNINPFDCESVFDPVKDKYKINPHPNVVWQVAVPNCGTTTLENVIRSGTVQPITTRFSDKICLYCDLDYFTNTIHMNWTKWSGSHGDFVQANSRFYQSLETGANGLMNFRDPSVYHKKLFVESANRYHDNVKFDFAFTSYANRSVDDLTFSEYMDTAFWRWNLFARGFYGDLGRNSFITAVASDVTITREHAEQTVKEGLKSDVYKIAYEKMHELTHIGIFERMEDSIELLCWTLCWDCDNVDFTFDPSRIGRVIKDPLPDDEQRIFEKYNNIDIQLYKDANDLFEQRFQEMKKQKARGYICDLRRSCLIELQD